MPIHLKRYYFSFSVCVNTLKKFKDEAPKELYDATEGEIEKAFMKFCEKMKGKEERFVRYIFDRQIDGSL